MMNTLIVHCQWEDETVRERTGHPPSYAEAKKMKLLTLHTHGCPRANLRDCSLVASCSIARAPAGRCKVVHLHPPGFCYTVFLQNTIHAQSLIQSRRQTLFYRVKYDSKFQCSTSRA